MKIDIKLHAEQINYDVGMITHVIMNREIGNGSSNEQAYNYANTEDESGEVHLISRFRESALLELVAMMAKYINDEEMNSENTFEKADAENYLFELEVSDNFKTSYVNPLRAKMHEYVVNRILYDWFMTAKPDEAHLYKVKYEMAEEKIKSYVNRRTGIARLKPYPRI